MLSSKCSLLEHGASVIHISVGIMAITRAYKRNASKQPDNEGYERENDCRVKVHHVTPISGRMHPPISSLSLVMARFPKRDAKKQAKDERYQH